ncbi:MAG: hypothetical protein ACR2PK_09940, partial [Acidimicrobiales bacterium]
VPGADRDLFDLAAANKACVLVVADKRVDRDWRALGAVGVIDADFDRQAVLEQLVRYATPVGRIDDAAPLKVAPSGTPKESDGRLVVVTGGSGAGTSTVAMAVAQELGDAPEFEDTTLLADLALRADQGMLHDAKDVVPGLQELVDSHRNGAPSGRELQSMVFKPHDRGYHLLLGLRRHQDWAVLRQRALQSSLDSLLSAYEVVVADVEADVEGEEETGSVEVEERNMLARSSLLQADLVLVVGVPTTKGLNDLVRVVHDLARFGVPGRLVIPVLNRTPRSVRSRSSIGGALSTLLQPVSSGLCSAVHLPHKQRIEDVLREGTRLPASFARPIGQAVRAGLERDFRNPRSERTQPLRITPGSVGQLGADAWNQDGAA